MNSNNMINYINTFITYTNLFFSHHAVLLCIFVSSISLKFYILTKLALRQLRDSRLKLPFIFLIGLLISTAIQEFEWVLLQLKNLFSLEDKHTFFIFWNRLSWSFASIQYLCLSLFIESMTQKNFKVQIRQKFFIVISLGLSFIFIFFSISTFILYGSTQKSSFEVWLAKISSFYSGIIMPVVAFFIIIKSAKESHIPRLLKKQIKLLLGLVIFPFWISDLIQITPFIFSFNLSWLNTSYTFASFSTILMTVAIYYCSRRILGLRFLNLNSQVQATVDINFMQNFKSILEQFSHVTSMQELTHITQGFFKEAFGVPHNRVQLYIRSTVQQQRGPSNEGSVPALVEGFLITHTKTVCEFIREHHILVYDEIAFTDFYESTPESSSSLAFLDAIQADIFLPIYEKQVMIGYITVDRYARLEAFYTNTEYDEMLIFVRYLGNIINLMQNKNLDVLIKQEKDLQEELYAKLQEINQYKESIRSFLRNQKHKHIGIIFYKNRRFVFGNQAAKELIQTNPNIHEGHPTSKALRHITHHVEQYKTAQSTYIKDQNGSKIILSAVPSLEHNTIIISVYYPEVTDIIKKQIDMLKDPSEWDYLLYLETTKPGKLINQLIPGSGETLLNFKIALLKTALSKKATLLNTPSQDVMQVVELLHHISLRETLHVIELSEPVKNFEVAISLFGINSLFAQDKKQTVPLLEKLDSIGTIFIKNIHFLDRETQEYLAEFIRYGYFRIFKSEHKIASNVRIICSTNQNLSLLVQEDRFSQALFNELKYTILEMPSLITLPEEELNTLADGFSEQAIANQTYKNLISLSEKDKYKLAHHRPASLLEMKQKIQNILVQKSKSHDLYEETQFDPAYNVSDPELIQAARLGKKALKDAKIMASLWNKFKNQNQIATFLGVNRSSVNRRCKKYNLTEE